MLWFFTGTVGTDAHRVMEIHFCEIQILTMQAARRGAALRWPKGKESRHSFARVPKTQKRPRALVQVEEENSERVEKWRENGRVIE